MAEKGAWQEHRKKSRLGERSEEEVCKRFGIVNNGRDFILIHQQITWIGLVVFEGHGFELERNRLHVLYIVQRDRVVYCQVWWLGWDDNCYLELPSILEILFDLFKYLKFRKIDILMTIMISKNMPFLTFKKVKNFEIKSLKNCIRKLEVSYSLFSSTFFNNYYCHSYFISD